MGSFHLLKLGFIGKNNIQAPLYFKGDTGTFSKRFFGHIETGSKTGTSIISFGLRKIQWILTLNATGGYIISNGISHNFGIGSGEQGKLRLGNIPG